jgi:hypothetical protein
MNKFVSPDVMRNAPDLWSSQIGLVSGRVHGGKNIRAGKSCPSHFRRITTRKIIAGQPASWTAAASAARRRFRTHEESSHYATFSSAQKRCRRFALSAHSKTLRARQVPDLRGSVLDCGGHPLLFPARITFAQ